MSRDQLLTNYMESVRARAPEADFDPKGHSDAEITRVCQAFMRFSLSLIATFPRAISTWAPARLDGCLPPTKPMRWSS